MFSRKVLLGAVAAAGIMVLPAAASAQATCAQVASANAFRGALCNIVVDIQIVRLDQQFLRTVIQAQAPRVVIQAVRADLQANRSILFADVAAALTLINSRRIGRA